MFIYYVVVVVGVCRLAVMVAVVVVCCLGLWGGLCCVGIVWL